MNAINFVVLSIVCIQQPAALGDWIPVEPEGARAKVLMPGIPQPSERTMEPVPGQKITVKLEIAQVDSKFTYIFAYHDQTPPKDAAELRKALDGGVKGAIARTVGSIQKVESVTVARLPGRQFEYTCIHRDLTLKIACRLLMDGGRMYQMTYIAPQADFNAEDAKKFLESFKLVKPGDN